MVVTQERRTCLHSAPVRVKRKTFKKPPSANHSYISESPRTNKITLNQLPPSIPTKKNKVWTRTTMDWRQHLWKKTSVVCKIQKLV